MSDSMPLATSYARISEKVERDKVADQHAQNRRHAKARGYRIIAEFTDDGISAMGHKTRPGFDSMLLAAESGAFQIIIATEEERLARNVEEKLELHAACEEFGVTWDTIRDGFVDPSTDSGEFMSTIRAAMGRIESRRKARRQIASNMERAADGHPMPGKRRYGFLGADVTTKRRVNTQEHPTEAEDVRAMFRRYLDGTSIVSLARERGWRPTRVRETLANPSYAGYVLRHGERFVAHESVARIVSWDDFENVQALLANKSRATNPGGLIKHMSSGIARCGVCGNPMMYRNSYLCLKDLSHPAIKGQFLDGRIRREVIAALTLPGIALQSDPIAGELRAVERRTALLIGRRVDALASLEDDSLGLTMSDLRPTLAPIARELESLSSRQQELVAQSTAATMLQGLKHSVRDSGTHRASIDRAAEVAVLLGERFDALSMERKRELIRGMVEVRVMPGRSQDRIKVRHLTEAAQVLNDVPEDAQVAA